MDRDMLKARPFQLALLALIVGLGLVGWTAKRASTIEPVTAGAPPMFGAADALKRPGMVVPPDIGAVASLNVFSANRKAPSRRYMLTGYADESPKPQPPKPVVQGTSIAPDNRSFAFVSVGDSRATIVRVGDIIGGYSVKAIDRGRVTFTAPTGEVLTIDAARF